MNGSGPDFEEPCKKKKKSTVFQNSRSTRTTSFAPPVSPGKMSEICNGYVPLTTVRATNWAVCVLDEWREERNKRCRERCPSDLLERPAAESVACSLCCGGYVGEHTEIRIRLQQSSNRPELRSTLPQLYMDYWKNLAFKELTGALKVRYRCLTDIHIAPCTQHSHETAGYMPLQTVTHIDVCMRGTHARTHTRTHAHTHTHTHTHTSI